MKKYVTIAVVVMMAAVSFGDLTVAWRATGGFYWVEDDSPLLANLGDQTIAQLVFTASGVRQQAAPGGGFYGDGDNVVIDTRIVQNTNPGDPLYTEYAPFTASYQGPFEAGWIYARIFQKDSVELDDWYFVTAVTAAQDIQAPTPPQSLQMNTDTTWGDPINTIDGSWTAFSKNPGDLGVTGVAQVIPEPATALMLILGGMGAWIFRRSKLRSQQEEEA